MRTWIGIIVAAVLCMLVVTQSANAGSLKAGAATSNLTPPLGDNIIGGFVPFPATHVHDDLHARCLVLDDGTTKLAIVVCDLLGIHRSVSEEARELIQEKTGIPPACVLITATHTHSATSALGDRAKPEPELNDYQRFIVRRIADGVTSAVNNLKPAQLGIGSVEVPEHLFNRRWHMRPGTMPPNPFGTQDLVKMNPPSGSPNLVEPAGPIDPVISLISVRDATGKPLSVFATYSLHYVGGVGNGHISADYYGVFCTRLGQLLQTEQQDPPFVALLANGTSGDINNINFKTPRPGKQPYEQMRYVAHDVAEKVHATLPSLKYRDDITLAARYREPKLAWRRPTPEQKQWAEQTIAKGPQSKADLSFIYAERATVLASYPETTPVPVQVLRIGDVCIGTMPCEVFCEIGLEYRNRSPLQPAFMVSLSHGYFGYLPTPRQHDLGGYETWIGTNRLEREASIKLLNELIEMTKEVVAADEKK